MTAKELIQAAVDSYVSGHVYDARHHCVLDVLLAAIEAYTGERYIEQEHPLLFDKIAGGLDKIVHTITTLEES